MSAPITIETAVPDDLPAMIAILAEDVIGGHGDAWDKEGAPAYRKAFAEIAASPDNILLVARRAGQVLGFLHLHLFRCLADHGALKGYLSTVFVAAAARGQKVGGSLVTEAERRARERGAYVVILVSNKRRLDSHRFYTTHGYSQVNEGFKKVL